MSRRKRFTDPAGERFGRPTFPRGAAPAGLLTRAQLARRGLLPGSHPAGQLAWSAADSVHFAELFRSSRAVRAHGSGPAPTSSARRRARSTCAVCGASAAFRLPVLWDGPRCTRCSGAVR